MHAKEQRIQFPTFTFIQRAESLWYFTPFENSLSFSYSINYENDPTPFTMGKGFWQQIFRWARGFSLISRLKLPLIRLLYFKHCDKQWSLSKDKVKVGFPFSTATISIASQPQMSLSMSRMQIILCNNRMLFKLNGEKIHLSTVFARIHRKIMICTRRRQLWRHFEVWIIRNVS